MVYAVVVAVVVVSAIHSATGLASICLGVSSSIKADVWLAHTVSPIWSGAFVSIVTTWESLWQTYHLSNNHITPIWGLTISILRFICTT